MMPMNHYVWELMSALQMDMYLEFSMNVLTGHELLISIIHTPNGVHILESSIEEIQ